MLATTSNNKNTSYTLTQFSKDHLLSSMTKVQEVTPQQRKNNNIPSNFFSQKDVEYHSDDNSVVEFNISEEHTKHTKNGAEADVKIDKNDNRTDNDEDGDTVSM